MANMQDENMMLDDNALDENLDAEEIPAQTSIAQTNMAKFITGSIAEKAAKNAAEKNVLTDFLYSFVHSSCVCPLVHKKTHTKKMVQEDWKKWKKFELKDDDGDCTLQCLNDEGESVGLMTFIILPGNPKVDIHIDTTIKGKGVGEALLNHFLTIITQPTFSHIQSIELEVFDAKANAAAIGLYLKKGFAWKEKDPNKRKVEKKFGMSLKVN